MFNVPTDILKNIYGWSDRKPKFNMGERLIDFSALVIDVVEALPDTRVGNHIAGQLLRSGTGVAPNHGEAQSAESRKDFVHKMKVALKELREALVWLKVVKRKRAHRR